jgi:uncharacterized phage protein (TIGR01671 family)
MNNRDIKFRVWNRPCKYFVEHVCMDGTFSVASFNLLSFSDYLKGNNICNIDMFVIQQYTGLKDTNGKEIYEGDIVKTVDSELSSLLTFSKYTNGVVTWINQSFKVCQKYIGATHLSDFALCDCCNCEQLEVIGNVFENAELV